MARKIAKYFLNLQLAFSTICINIYGVSREKKLIIEISNL